MTRLRTLAALAVVAVGMTAVPVQAESVSYLTSGAFTYLDATNTLVTSNVYDRGDGVVIVFTGSALNDVTVPPASFVSFGTFDTIGSTATALTDVLASFTLTITQVAPGATGTNPIEFTGALTGQFSVSNSAAFVAFDSPLLQTIDTATAPVSYQITSTDDGSTKGLVIMASASAGSTSTIVGRVNAIPEPSTLVLAGLAGPLVLLYQRRRRVA